MAYTPFNPYQSPFYPVQMPQQIQQQTSQQQGGLSSTSRPVGNREEANSVPADFSGAPMVFPDIAHNRVYIKQWNYQTGTADFMEYARISQQDAPEKPKQEKAVFAPMEDLESVKAQLNALKEDFEKWREKGSCGNDCCKERGKKE